MGCSVERSIYAVFMREFINTFYSNHGENAKIEYLDVAQCYEEDDYATENKAFFKYLKAATKKWRPKKKNISVTKLKKYTEESEIPVRYILKAIWIKNTYSLSEFCGVFGVDAATAKDILASAGYLKRDTDVDYFLIPQFWSDIEGCLNKSRFAYRELGLYVSVRNRILRATHRGMQEFGERISTYAKSRDFFVHPLSSWDEPAYAKRSDWKEHLISGLLVIFMLFTIVFGIFIFYLQMHDNAIEQQDTLYGFWGSIIAAFIGGLVTIGTTYFIIKRSYKLDYHQERLSVMPVFDLSLELSEFRLEADNEPNADLTDIVKKDECYSPSCEIEKAMLLKIHNVGKGIAFQVEIEGLTSYYEEPTFQSITNDTKKYVILDFRENFVCTIKFYDIYGNYYYQKFFTRNKTDLNRRIYISTCPPELVLRTNRMRYVQ